MKPKILIFLVGIISMICAIGSMLISEFGLVSFFAGCFGGTLAFVLLISLSDEIEKSPDLNSEPHIEHEPMFEKQEITYKEPVGTKIRKKILMD